MQVWLLPVLAALAVLVSPATAQNKLVNVSSTTLLGLIKNMCNLISLVKVSYHYYVLGIYIMSSR